MKTYIGTKEIEATPMNRLEYNKYRGWELPADENGEDEGYLVEYAGDASNHPNHKGYISWSPKEQFENAHIEANKCTEFLPKSDFPHEQRVLDEAIELEKKLDALTAFISTNPIFTKLPEEQQRLLKQQQLTMRGYLAILAVRMAGFTYLDPNSTAETAPDKGLSFGQALEALKQGKLISRVGWNGKGMFIVKQIPSVIGVDIIPKMQSLPPAVKDVFIAREQSISYGSQMLIINSTGKADSWVPSSSDCFAEDWVIVQ
jgi:hypothetical protein